MSGHEPAPKRSLKERAVEELRTYWVITLYLWLFLASFTAYRRLILDEIGQPHVPYGIALIEALVIAKVVLVGRVFGFSRRFEDQRLIVPVVYKSIIFGLLVVAFSVLEHLVMGWVHGRGALGGLREFATVGAYEIAARLLAMVVAFVPFFAFYELGRVMGMRELAALFFARPPAADAGPAQPV
jgi:hypothetical protein